MSRRQKGNELAVADALMGLMVVGFLCLVVFPQKLAGILLIGLTVGVLLAAAAVFIWKQTQKSTSVRDDFPATPSFDPAQRPERSQGNISSHGQQKPAPPAAGGTSASGYNPARDARASAPSLSNAEKIRQALHSLDWFQFEKLVTLYYQTQGYSVRRVGGAKADGGVDIILEHQGKRYVIQCKHWKTWRVGVKEMREFLGTLTDTRIPNGIYITTRGYTDEARDFASKHHIQLFEEAQLVQCILDLEATQRQAVSELLADRRKFCPRCESEMFVKEARKGRNPGSKFWGCSRYPVCDFTFPLDQGT